VLGKDHPQTGLALSAAGHCLVQLGRNQEAIACFRDAVRIFEISEGPDFPLVRTLKGIVDTMSSKDAAEGRKEK